MYNYLQEIFWLLNTQDNQIIVMGVYIGLCLFPVLLRIIAYLGYKAGQVAFKLEARDIKGKDDIKKIRYGLLKKIIADYIRVADRNVTRIPAEAIVDRHIRSLSFLGWRYEGILQLAESLENGLIFVGLILALVFSGYQFVFGTLAAAAFVLTRLMAMFFNGHVLRRDLEDDLILYVHREVGQYYAADGGAAVLRMKTELSEAINRQTASLQESIGKLGIALSESVSRNLTVVNAALEKPIHDWEQALSSAGKVQAQINASGEQMQTSAQHLAKASDLLSKHLQGHSTALSEQLGGLVSAVEAVKEGNAVYAGNHEAFLKEAKYIERNQALLETSVQSFETTLKQLTQTLGDGLGVIVQLQAQNAAQTVNDALRLQIEKITASNQETLTRMAALFEQLQVQSKDVSGHLLALHEKIAVLEKAVDRHG